MNEKLNELSLPEQARVAPHRTIGVRAATAAIPAAAPNWERG